MQKISGKCEQLFVEQRFEEALEVSNEILSTQPNEPYHNFNHSLILDKLGRIEESYEYLEKVKDARPDCPIIRYYLTNICLTLGKFREGFENKEWRFTVPYDESYNPNPVVFTLLPKVRAMYEAPNWDGTSDLNGKKVVVFNEAGHGDSVQGIRYLYRLKEKGAYVILEAKSELYRLFENISSVDKLIRKDKADKMSVWFSTFTNQGKKTLELPEHDYVVSVNSMNYFFDPDLDQTPINPYIFLSDKPKNPAIEIVNKYKDKFKIGLCFAGRKEDYHDSVRSMHLRRFKPISDLPNVQLFSLQKGPMKRTWFENFYSVKSFDVDLMEGSETVNFENFEPLIKDFYDVAQIASHLDLIISIDTAVAHVVGAIGKPVWMLCSVPNHEWRWQKQWYQSMEVFDQRKEGDWDGLILELAEKLKQIT